MGSGNGDDVFGLIIVIIDGTLTAGDLADPVQGIGDEGGHSRGVGHGDKIAHLVIGVADGETSGDAGDPSRRQWVTHFL